MSLLPTCFYCNQNDPDEVCVVCGFTYKSRVQAMSSLIDVSLGIFCRMPVKTLREICDSKGFSSPSGQCSSPTRPRLSQKASVTKKNLVLMLAMDELAMDRRNSEETEYTSEYDILVGKISEMVM